LANKLHAHAQIAILAAHFDSTTAKSSCSCSDQYSVTAVQSATQECLHQQSQTSSCLTMDAIQKRKNLVVKRKTESFNSAKSYFIKMQTLTLTLTTAVHHIR